MFVRFFYKKHGGWKLRNIILKKKQKKTFKLVSAWKTFLEAKLLYEFNRRYRNVFWFVAMHFGLSQCILVCRNAFWFVAMHFGLSQCILVCRNVFWFVAMHFGLSQCILVCRNAFWFVAMHFGLSQCILVFHGG